MNVVNKRYICDTTKYIIEYGIIDVTANIDIVNCDFRYPNAFASLLRKSIDELKNNGVKFITQVVMQSDWNDFLCGVTTWKVVTRRNEVYTIECSIDDVLKNIAIGLGVDMPTN